MAKPAPEKQKRDIKLQVMLNEEEAARLQQAADKASTVRRPVARAAFARRLIRKGLGLPAED